MMLLADLPDADARAVKVVLTDIADTLTTDGRLTAQAYGALERLYDAGFVTVPITGRPAGWCDHIARMWPVQAVVGENGAFYFAYDRDARRMRQHFWTEAGARAADRRQLDALGADILAVIPGAGLASDQPYRIADLAIDVREDVAPLSEPEIDRIVALRNAAAPLPPGSAS